MMGFGVRKCCGSIEESHFDRIVNFLDDFPALYASNIVVVKWHI